MSDISIQIAEIQLLKHLLDNPDNIQLCEESYFITDIALDIFASISEVYSKGIKCTDSHILSEMVKRNPSLDQRILTKIRDVHTEDDQPSFDFYYFRMKEEFCKTNLSEKQLPDAIINLAKKGKVNLNVVDGLINDLTELRNLANGYGRLTSYSGREAIEQYEDHIQKQLDNPNRSSTGDWYLDQSGIKFLEGEITILFSNSGSGKSTAVQHIAQGRMIQQLPFSWYITEMSTSATMNRVAASTSDTLHKSTFEPKMVDDINMIDEAATKHLSRMKRKYGMKNSWRLVPCDEEPLTLDILEEDIPNQRRLLGLKPDEPLLIIIDLLTMVKEFAPGSIHGAGAIEEGMNRLSFLAKKHKIHVLGVVQAKEKRGQNITVKKMDDVFKYRPVLEDIKNSSAFTERARTILMSFRPMNIINKFDILKEDPLVDLVEDVLYMTVLKTNHGKEGTTLHYKFDGSRANLRAYPSFGGWSSQFDILDEDEEIQEAS